MKLEREILETRTTMGRRIGQRNALLLLAVGLALGIGFVLGLLYK